MEHLLNCHGELTALASLLSSLPFVGMLIRTLRLKNPYKGCAPLTRKDAS